MNIRVEFSPTEKRVGEALRRVGRWVFFFLVINGCLIVVDHLIPVFLLPSLLRPLVLGLLILAFYGGSTPWKRAA